ncbi:MAG: hypothetical protein KF878_33170, partial [Planctomycetes bacterium]|nr:hypothetical protein [Planctomycetota bacterium]
MSRSHVPSFTAFAVVALLAVPVARAQPAVDPSPFGVNAHLAGDALLDRLADAGVRWLRIDIDWSHVERVRGQHDWGDVDRVVGHAERRGLSVFGTIAYTPAWASGSADHAVPPRDPADYLAFVREVARRYRGRVQALGIWNEPNLREFWKGSRAQFIQAFLVPGLRVLRAEAPGTLTCGPDLSSSGAWRRDWLDPILRAAGPLFDVITHHQYDGRDTVGGRLAELDLLRQFLRLAGHGSKPVWVTEIGWKVGPRVSLDDQARHLRGVYQGMAARPWWTKTFWYDSHGAGWGLLGPDGAPDAGQPRPAYFAYRDLARG